MTGSPQLGGTHLRQIEPTPLLKCSDNLLYFFLVFKMQVSDNVKLAGRIVESCPVSE